jgi:uncharacterized protein YgiM (DUF1202 family)
VLGKSSDNQWYAVNYNGRQAWILRSTNVALTGNYRDLPVANLRGTTALSEPYLTVNTEVSVRTEPSFSADTLERVVNVQYEVLGKSSDSQWYAVNYNGRQAWILRSTNVGLTGNFRDLPVINP